MKFTTYNDEETIDLGRRLGELLLPGTVIGLSGTLGTGKTRLTQGIGLGLGIPPDTINSPTFTLCVPYFGRYPLLHLDAYRIQDPNEIDELALDESVEDGAILVIEWAERYLNHFPELDLRIQINHEADGSRTITFEFISEQIKRVCTSLCTP